MAKNSDNDRDPRNSGFINLRWDDGKWSIGGTYTDANNKQWDLGYIVTGQHCLNEAIATIVKQIGPTLNGKGMVKERRQR